MCYIRHIRLHSGGQVTQLPSDELMMTSWVPREANVRVINIPPDLDFLADIAYTAQLGTAYKVMPVFPVQNENVAQVLDHVGDFELEVVVIGDNFVTAKRTIKFQFKGKPESLLPLT
jgi:hypothetical protein